MNINFQCHETHLASSILPLPTSQSGDSGSHATMTKEAMGKTAMAMEMVFQSGPKYPAMYAMAIPSARQAVGSADKVFLEDSCTVSAM